jgi:hypothetical protein
MELLESSFFFKLAKKSILEMGFGNLEDALSLS